LADEKGFSVIRGEEETPLLRIKEMAEKGVRHGNGPLEVLDLEARAVELKESPGEEDMVVGIPLNRRITVHIAVEEPPVRLHEGGEDEACGSPCCGQVFL
jgi:hypothetical protein